MAEILKIIAASPTDVQPVLDAVVVAAVRFCNATDATISLRDGDEMVRRAHFGQLPTTIGARRPLARDSASARSIFDGRTIHHPDMEALNEAEFPTGRRLAREYGYRAALAAPMLREGIAIGNVVLRKIEVGPFTPEQIELLQTLAAQATIAIENVRLLGELRERQNELRDARDAAEATLERQTATVDILKIIAASPTNVQPVLDAVAKAAMRFCGAEDVLIGLRDGDQWVFAAHQGPMAVQIGERMPLTGGGAPSRAMRDSKTVHLPDIAALDPIEFASAHEFARRHGFRAVLAAPLLREGIAIGAVATRRSAAGAFTPLQIELLETFAAQAVIAIENVRLFTELRDSLERLKAAQANLVQSEKMASLGQLTAGIAHEIKNPLNFVNNFATLSIDLLDELKHVAGGAFDALDADKRAEVDESMTLLTNNLGKIAEHGRRADGIVKSMLSHSRGGTGDWQVSDINALVEETLNLAYHGARAQNKDFNVTLERDFDQGAKPIEVVPQDITRMFLNLFGNGFYAVGKRRQALDGGFRPTLKVSTRDSGEMVEVKVRDNGTGIPPESLAKLFQPFFTTKPTGEGTGLGLSISYDIVTQQHRGTIEVASEVGSFTEFTVRLPRGRRVA